MKQMKFVLMALMAVVLGVSVTSCMKGEDNPIVPVNGIITLKNTFPYQFQVEGSDVVFEASNMTIPGLASDAYSGDIVLLNSQYNRNEQQVDQNTKKIIVEALGALKLNSNTSATSSSDVTSNRSILPLSNYGYDLAPYLYGPNWIIFPMPFYVEKQDDLSAHMFYLVYDKEHADNNQNTMVLRLRHVSSGDVKKESTIVTTYKAFNIRNLVSEFAGETLKTIKIITQEKSGDSPEITSGSTNSYREQTYTISNYDKYVK